MEAKADSMTRKNHEWGWAALIIAIVVVNLGAHVWQEFRGCTGAAAKLKLCQADPSQVSNHRR